MDNSIYEAIKQICISIQENDQDLARLINQSPESNALQVQEEIQNFLTEISKIHSEGKQLAEGELQPMLPLLDFALVHLYDLMILCHKRSELNQPMIWKHQEMKGIIPKPTFLFGLLICNLANTLLAIRTLICLGLDNQARILFRSYVEFADLTLGVTYDFDLFKTYCASRKDYNDAYKIWKTSLTPNKIRKFLSIIDQESGLPEDISKIIIKEREDIYQWLSTFAHGEWVAMVLGMYARDMKEEEVFKTSPGGQISRASKATLLKAVLYTWQFLLYLVYILKRKHDFSVKQDDSDAIWFLYRHEIYMKLLLSLYQQMSDDIYDNKSNENTS